MVHKTVVSKLAGRNDGFTPGKRSQAVLRQAMRNLHKGPNQTEALYSNEPRATHQAQWQVQTRN